RRLNCPTGIRMDKKPFMAGPGFRPAASMGHEQAHALERYKAFAENSDRFSGKVAALVGPDPRPGLCAERARGHNGRQHRKDYENPHVEAYSTPYRRTGKALKQAVTTVLRQRLIAKPKWSGEFVNVHFSS